MDKTDVILSQLLMANSRLPYRQLADKLNLSVNAVHKRIQALRESGIIRKFTAKPSLFALNALSVLVFGNSEAHSINEACEKLGNHDSTYWVAIAGGNRLYVGAYLRNVSELEAYTSYVKKGAQMPDPTVGIVHFETPPFPPAPQDAALNSLDYQIICALQKNSRKPISEVAEGLDISAKTTRRRLSRMIRDELIELSIEWYPDASNDIMALFHLHLGASTDRNEAGRLLTEKYSPNVIFYWSFSNLPNLLLPVVWTSTMKELRDIRERLEGEAFESAVPYVLYTGYLHDTWRDKLVLEKGAPPHPATNP